MQTSNINHQWWIEWMNQSTKYQPSISTIWMKSMHWLIGLRENRRYVPGFYYQIISNMSCKRVPSNKTDGMDGNESKWDGYGMEMGWKWNSWEWNVLIYQCAWETLMLSFFLQFLLEKSWSHWMQPIAPNTGNWWKPNGKPWKWMGNRWKLLKFPKLMRICFGPRDIRIYQASPRAIWELVWERVGALWLRLWKKRLMLLAVLFLNQIARRSWCYALDFIFGLAG